MKMSELEEQTKAQTDCFRLVKSSGLIYMHDNCVRIS